MTLTVPVELPRAPTTVSRPLTDDLVIAAMGVFAAAGWAVGWSWPSFGSDVIVAGVNVLVTATFVTAAVFIAHEPDRHHAGLLILLGGLLWPLNSSAGWNVGPLPFIRSLIEGFFWIVLALALFLYQHSNLGRAERFFLGYAFFHFIILELIWGFLSVPEWVGYPSTVWWPTLFANRSVFDVFNKVLISGDLPIAIAFAVIMLRRQRHVSGLDRYSMVPVVAAIVVAAIVAGLSWATYGKTVLADALALLALPVAFLVTALRRRLCQARVSDVLTELAGTPLSSAVTQALRTALRDPSLKIFYWAPQRQTHLDEHGREVDHPTHAAERMQIPVTANDGRPLAVVSTTAPSSSNRAIVEAAVQASGLAIENAHLQTVVHAQLESIRQAHRRIVQVSLDERRRLERNLHDGAQQRLLAAAASIELASTQLGKDEIHDTLKRASDELQQSLQELRQLARGLHPAILTSEGLAAAVQAMIERLPTPVRIDITSTRLPPTVEATAYFVICEALTNLIKHSGAIQAHVTARLDKARRLQLQICDDGVGGADRNGTGISGMADRIQAMGGEFTIRSEPGNGTLITAWLPCA